MKVLFAAVLMLALACGCHRDQAARAAAATGGDVQLGRLAISKFGCNTCHTIPGIVGVRGLVGPPLSQFGARVYIAGMLPNTPENLVRWISQPKSVNPATAMPNLFVSESEARDIAAYLYSLD